jgi:transcriptional regulator with XRE-family HTH domain
MKSKEKRRAIRRHFIKEWMEDREMTPADIVDALDIDKSQVYRWLKGQLPQPDMQERLATLFEIAPEALLHHPDDDWVARFFEDREPEERARIKQAMELAWPPRRS